jgi:uncharacterized protein (DUF488 family)
MTPVFTIGYGNRALDRFVRELAELQIQYLIDIRSNPRSRFKPEFSRPELAAALKTAGLKYVFMGDALGGRPEDPECYHDGHVQYDVVRQRPYYQAGIQRIRSAFSQGLRVCLMCSEAKPEDCHRSKLIGVTLDGLGIEVIHIGPAGEQYSQCEVLAKIQQAQASLFGDSLMSRKAYRQPGRQHQRELRAQRDS